MWGCSVASALMTSPSALSDLLIACASFSCSPVDPDFFTLQRTPAPGIYATDVEACGVALA